MSHDRAALRRLRWSWSRPGSAAAAAGFVAAMYPTALPLVVLVGTTRWPRWQRTDVLWLAAFGLLVVGSARHGTFDWNVLGVASAWLVNRVARAWSGDGPTVRALGSGLLIGSAILFLWGVVQVVGLGDGRASGPTWFHHPNVLAHAWLPLAGLAVVSTMKNVPAGVSAVIYLLAVATTGSRSGVVAGLAAAGVLLVGCRPPRRVAFGTLAMLIVVGLVVGAVPRPPWLDRLVGPWSFTMFLRAPVNLFSASEALDDPGWWAPLQVAVDRTSEEGVVPASWRVTRTAEASWSRPQQTIVLDPGVTYTWSVELRGSEGPLVPGLLGWGTDGGTPAELLAVLDSGVPGATSAGRISAVRVDAVPISDGWVRLAVAFDVGGDAPLAVGMGPIPDQSSSFGGAAVEVRAMQLERGTQPSAYQPTVVVAPGAAVLARGEAMARIPLWRAAWQGFVERPLFGWGYAAYGSYGVERFGLGDGTRHAHNLWLHILFEGGVVGVLALLLVVVALWHEGGRVSRAVLTGLLLANLFDSTLYALVVLMPAAMLSGIDAAVTAEGPTRVVAQGISSPPNLPAVGRRSR